jgi:hypothetical protein
LALYTESGQLCTRALPAQLLLLANMADVAVPMTVTMYLASIKLQENAARSQSSPDGRSQQLAQSKVQAPWTSASMKHPCSRLKVRCPHRSGWASSSIAWRD